jgi:transcriptional regulator with XRE-family HTH domain
MAKARRFAGITQTEMAEQLGVNPATINRWEKGTSRVTRADVIAWAFLTGVELVWLEGGDSPVTASVTQRYQVAA